jgi:uncharacterized protein (AIM24 family)
MTTYTLAPNETLLAHPGHIGLFEETVQFSITTVPGIKNKIFGADGFFLVRLTGPGQIWLQSLTLPGLAAAISHYLPGQSAAAAPQRGGGIASMVGNILNQ